MRYIDRIRSHEKVTDQKRFRIQNLFISSSKESRNSFWKTTLEPTLINWVFSHPSARIDYHGPKEQSLSIWKPSELFTEVSQTHFVSHLERFVHLEFVFSALFGGAFRCGSAALGDIREFWSSLSILISRSLHSDRSNSPHRNFWICQSDRQFDPLIRLFL